MAQQHRANLAVGIGIFKIQQEQAVEGNHSITDSRGEVCKISWNTLFTCYREEYTQMGQCGGKRNYQQWKATSFSILPCKIQTLYITLLLLIWPFMTRLICDTDTVLRGITSVLAWETREVKLIISRLTWRPCDKRDFHTGLRYHHCFQLERKSQSSCVCSKRKIYVGFNGMDIWPLDTTGPVFCSPTVQIASDQESGDFEPFFLLQKGYLITSLWLYYISCTLRT